MDCKAFRTEKGLGGIDVVECLRQSYPRFGKSTLSMVEHPSSYGVQLVPHAEEILTAVFGAPAGKRVKQPARPFRRKPCRLCVYLPADRHAQVKQLMRQNNIATAQQLLEFLLDEWLERSEAPWNS